MRDTFMAVFAAGIVLANTGPATATEEVSGIYYDYTITNQPERPWMLPYDRTLVTKMFLCSRTGTGGVDQIYQTFGQALETIQRLDRITTGIPKVVYLVGWQHNGHDSKWPDWNVVNPALKRPEDATALDSLRWLIREGAKYHTRVSLHLNMFDAYEDSPLWQSYVDQDIISKDAQGNVIFGETHSGMRSSQISYTREWELGLAQKRIDDLLAMVPELAGTGTIHIDAFHSMRPLGQNQPVSPYLGHSVATEAATQRKIYRYWRNRGIDVTSEGAAFLRPDGFVGLQPFSWVNESIVQSLPDSLYASTPMKAETEIRTDPVNLPGLTSQFCRTVMPWYIANVTGSAPASELTSNGNVLLPALWSTEPTLVAYSQNGYSNKTWSLPATWQGVTRVSSVTLSPTGVGNPVEIPVVNGTISLAMGANEERVLTAIDSPVIGDQTWLDTNSNNDWSTTALNWDAGAVWTQGNNANFGGTGETVTLTQDITIGNLSFNSTGYTVSGSTLTLGAASVITTAADATISSVLTSGTNSVLTKLGPSTLTLTGANTLGNSNRADVTINGGTLQVTGTGVLFSNNNVATSVITVNSGTTLEIDRFAWGSNTSFGKQNFANGNLVFNGGTLRYSGADNVSETNNGRGFTIGVNGATLESAAGSGGTWRIPGSITSSAGGTLTLKGNSNGRLDGALGGTGGLTKSGSGIWTLTGTCSYTGATTINAGKLVLAGADNGGQRIATASNITINNGGTLEVGSINVINQNKFTIHAGGVLNMATGKTAWLQGALTLDGGTLAGADAGFGGFTFILSPNGANPTQINVTGDVTSTISAQNVGLLQNGTLEFNVADGASATDLIVTGNFKNNGTSGLNKTGAGTMVLAGANTYTGATAVNAGSLAVVGTLGTTAVTVASGATLDAGSNLSGMATMGSSVQVNSGGHFAFHIAANPASQVTRTLTGTLTLAAGNVLDLTAAATPVDGNYTLATAAAITGTPGVGTTLTLAPGRTATLSVSGTSLVLTIGSGGYDSWDDQITNGRNLRNEDADDDGFTNLQEFLFGTDPMSGTSTLSTTETVGGDFIIRWKERASGASYRLMESATLSNPWIQSGATITADGAQVGDYIPRKAVIAIGSGKDFFRVEGVEN